MGDLIRIQPYRVLLVNHCEGTTILTTEVTLLKQSGREKWRAIATEAFDPPQAELVAAQLSDRFLAPIDTMTVDIENQDTPI